MKFDDQVESILSELRAQTVHVNAGPTIDGIQPDGGNEFYGNINKMGPNKSLGKVASGMFYQKKPKTSKKKRTKNVIFSIPLN
jgi:hypothetical protein